MHDAARREVRLAGERYPAMHDYAWWPKMGFDASLARARMDAALPLARSGAQSVAWLLELPGGEAWW
jgi:hypothetical protein